MAISNRALGVFIWFGYRIPIPQRTRIIKESGFKTVLHWWDDSFIDSEIFTKEEQSIRDMIIFGVPPHIYYWKSIKTDYLRFICMIIWGENDDHLASGEGRVDWGIVRAGIESSVYTGSFTLEVDTAKTLVSRTPQEHLMLCYKSAVNVLS